MRTRVRRVCIWHLRPVTRKAQSTQRPRAMVGVRCVVRMVESFTRRACNVFKSGLYAWCVCACGHGVRCTCTGRMCTANIFVMYSNHGVQVHSAHTASPTHTATHTHAVRRAHAHGARWPIPSSGAHGHGVQGTPQEGHTPHGVQVDKGRRDTHAHGHGVQVDTRARTGARCTHGQPFRKGKARPIL